MVRPAGYQAGMTTPFCHPNSYPAGVKVTNAEMDAINIQRHEFHGDWNYTISPQLPVRSDSS